LPLLAGPISYFQAVVLGLLQGFAELFPISSLGHSVILPRLLGWNIHQDDKYFIAFLVATHLATAIVLLVFFGRDWIRILTGMWRSLVERDISPENPEARLGWLVVVATIPAGILGLLLQDKLQSVFASARSAAFFLILNGFMLYGAELLRRRAPGVPEGDSDDDVRIVKRVGWLEALGVGAAQAIALIPGFSRSGASMGGSLLAGLSNEDSARFAFLLGPDGNGVRGPAIAASLCAAVTAYLSVRFLMRYFETNRLTPFAIYCVIAGVATSIYFTVN
jgi:undecaprenyl-diphosphatase